MSDFSHVAGHVKIVLLFAPLHKQSSLLYTIFYCKIGLPHISPHLFRGVKKLIKQPGLFPWAYIWTAAIRICFKNRFLHINWKLQLRDKERYFEDVQIRVTMSNRNFCKWQVKVLTFLAQWTFFSSLSILINSFNKCS